MCYAAPGPRCSKHAETKLLAANRAYQKFVLSGGSSTDQGKSKLARLRSDAIDARDQFDMTPKGQQVLTKKIATEQDAKKRSNLEFRKEFGAARREEALAAVKEQGLSKLSHDDTRKEARAQRLDERFAARVERDKHELEQMNIERKRKGLMPLSSKNSLALDRPTGGYSSYDVKLIPQASDLEKISSTVDVVGNGAASAKLIAESFDVDARQGNYYGNAAEYIGLVERTEGYDGAMEYRLTTNGELFRNASPEERHVMLRTLVNETPVMKAFHESKKNEADLQGYIAVTGNYEESVAKRRASSIINWDKKLNNAEFAEVIGASSTTAVQRSLAVAKAENERRIAAKLHKTPAEKDYGTCPTHFTKLPATGRCDMCD